MKRYHFLIKDELADKFEQQRTDLNLSKTLYFERLIENDKTDSQIQIPKSIMYKDLISEMSNLNNTVKRLILQPSLSDTDKLKLHNAIDEMNKSIKRKM